MLPKRNLPQARRNRYNHGYAARVTERRILTTNLGQEGYG